MKKSVFILSLFLLMPLFAGSLLGVATGSWTGEVLDMDCYKGRGAHGPDHAKCATACLRRGQPMGLLTDDGTLVLLQANEKNQAPYDRLKAMAGEKAVVSGVLAEKDGMKIVTVEDSKKAE